jgi:hypothetical protein
VTYRWRKRLQEDGIDTVAVAGTGFRVLTEGEKVHTGMRDARCGVRRIVRGTRRAEYADLTQIVDPHERATANVIQRGLQGLAEEVRQHARKLVLTIRATKALPRVTH